MGWKHLEYANNSVYYVQNIHLSSSVYIDVYADEVVHVRVYVSCRIAYNCFLRDCNQLVSRCIACGQKPRRMYLSVGLALKHWSDLQQPLGWR